MITQELIFPQYKHDVKSIVETDLSNYVSNRVFC